MKMMTTAVGAIIAALCGVPLTAQTLAPPVRGQDLTAQASVGAGYDDDVFAETQSLSAVSPLIGTSASYGLADLGLTYAATGRRITFGAAADSSVRYYRLDDPFTARRYSGSAALSVDLTERMRATASVSAQRSSHHIFWIFPALAEPPLGQLAFPSLDFSLTSTTGRSYDSGAALTYSLTRRSTLSADYGYGEARFGEADFDLKRERWAGRYTNGFTRYASLRLGYGIEDATYVNRQRFRRRTIDVGVDYARPLSFSRRTTLSFGVGTAGLDDGQATYYTLTGHANLIHQLARRWGLNAAYNRNVGFISGFLQPFLSDSAALSTTGRLHRRLMLTMSAAYSNGTVGFDVEAPRYETYTGSARIQFLLGRGVSAFGESVYYHSRFDEQVALPLNSPRSLDRHGLRGGLNYTVEVF